MGPLELLFVEETRKGDENRVPNCDIFIQTMDFGDISKLEVTLYEDFWNFSKITAMVGNTEWK